MREGRELVGCGMASGIWEAATLPTSARRAVGHGKLEVACATADIGTGTYTILTQIGGGRARPAMESVTASIGDSSLPNAFRGRIHAAASAGSAVQAACFAVREKLIGHARGLDASPLANASLEHNDLRGRPHRADVRSDARRHIRRSHAGRRRRADRGDWKGGPGMMRLWSMR